MEIGLTYTLKSDVTAHSGAPDDALEEYDADTTVEAVAASLRRLGHTVRHLGYGRALLERLLVSRPDLVFNLAEGVGGRSREAHVPAVLEMLGIPVTHSDPLTLCVTQDKAVAKQIVAACGVTTPAFRVVHTTDEIASIDLPFPLFVKPLFEGSSMGVRQESRVEDERSLRAQVERIVEGYRQPALVEEFCPGPEFTVAVLGTGPSASVLGVRGVTSRHLDVARFVYSIDRKRDGDNVLFDDLSRHPDALIAAMRQGALDAYRALGCRDVGRVDIRVNAAGKPAFLELNALPGITPGWSDLPLIAESVGLDYDALIAKVLDHARARYGL